MAFDPASALKSIPSSYPSYTSRGIDRDQIEKELGRYGFSGHVAIWIFVIGETFIQRQIWRRIPGYMHISVGYWQDHNDEDSYNFGVIAYTDPRTSRPIEDPPPMEIDGYYFPITIRPWTLEPNARLSGVHPMGGLPTCHAESKRLAKPHDTGFLTANHTVFRNPQGVVLTNRGVSNLLDVAPPGIDAALVEYPIEVSSPPSPQRIVTTKAPLIPAVAVDFEDQHGTRISAYILAVSPVPPMNSYLPYIFEIDQAGRPGDSGAMVSLTGTGEECGIYIGRTKSDNGSIVGYCQHLGQVEYVMSLQLFQ